MRYPKINLDEVRANINQQSRQPFRELLATVMGCQPSPDALQAIAEKNPDRWAQMLAIIARLGGYTEKLEIEGTVTTRAMNMSDAELELMIQTKLLEMKDADPK